ncbi:hypothetical protein NHX12_022758, partial [Muraenolepis orangiensis]
MSSLDNYCGSVFWNSSFVDTAEPDLPVCVEQTVLVWVPLGFLWICSPWHLASLFRRPGKPSHLSRLYLSKQLVAGLLFITAIAGLSLTLGEDYGPSRGTGGHATVFYVNPIIQAVSWVLVLLSQEGLRRRAGAVDSSALFLFWFILVVCQIFPFQTLLREALRLKEVPDIPRFCLFYVSFALELAGLVLSSWADVPRDADNVRRNPEARVAFLNRITFNWFNSMVVKGYKRPLVQEDMWELKESDTVHQISGCFQVHMRSELGAARLRFQKKRSEANPGDGVHLAMKNGVSQDVLMMSWLIPAIYKTFMGVLLESAFFKLLQDLLAFVSPQLLKLMISFTRDTSAHAWQGYMYAVLLVLVAILQSLFLQQYFQRCFVLGMKVRTAIMAAVYKKALVMSNSSRKQTTVGETVNLMSADAQRFNDVTNFIHLLWSCPLQIALSIAFLWLEMGPSVLAGLAVMVFMILNMKFKDQRLKIMNEILNGMKILKLYAWEPSFQSQVDGIRGQELQIMRKFAYLNSVSTFIFSCAPALVSLATFAVFVGVSPDNVLNAEKAFTAIALFNILRFPLAMLPMLIAAMVQTAVSKKRLEKFLSSDDLDPDIVHSDPSFSTAVSVCDGTFTWEREADPILKNISLDVGRGKLVAVVGAVGSGKSSLISALLGEMHSVQGFVNLQGSVAYVPQQAWIQNATLRDNILFGSPHDSIRFQSVLDACALGPDLELLPGADLTEIGEKGINLSGGQKQRVSLARAAYSHSDIYLLDDPLSAVDSHVGKHLFQEVIGPQGLLKDKTRILVTHGVSFLPYVDEIVVLVDGKVSEVGSYQRLQANKGAFSHFLNTYAKDNDNVRLRSNSSLQKNEVGPDVKKGQRLIEKEGMETGQVKFSVYLQYLRAMGWGYSALVFLMYTIQNTAFLGQNLWLSDWTNDAVDYYNMTYPNWKRDTRIGVFGALGVAQGLFVFIGTLLMADGSVSASRILHSKLLHTILRVPMSFFDTTPSGRVVNRFAKDIFTVDESIPQCFRSWLLCLLGVLGTLFVICLATPFFAVVIIPLAVVYMFVQRFYVATSRQLRRLDSVSRSPVYSHFGETVSGLSVIRAYGHQERFLNHNETTIDQNTKSVYPWIVSNRWLAIRLEFLGNLVVFFAALFAVISRNSLDSGLVTQTLNWLVRMTSELETNIVAVERVSEYTELEHEAKWVSETPPPGKWPDAGRLQFENYKVRYRAELDLIGIVGRTGAGKSSLTNCLFRIIEAAEGRIIIDGIDISKIGLMNLDPFESFSDEDIWRVLELSHLKEYVVGLENGLQFEVSEGGENLSVGQRQLLCLGRALLRKSRILILDEATAAVDLETDNLIQNTIRKEFSHCTVLTVAHRLQTIMDSS